MHLPIENSVRPSFRVLGAVLTISAVLLFGSEGISSLSATNVPLSSCSSGRFTSRVLCQAGTLLLSLLPGEMRGIVLGVTQLLVAAAFVAATWFLLRPMIIKAIQDDEASRWQK